MDGMFEMATVIGFLSAAVRLSTPLLLAALGELVSERAGVLNLSVEGMMLTGALFGFLGAYFTGSLAAGWLIAMGMGALVALVFAFFAVTLCCHQVIVALGINMMTLGATGFIYRLVFGLSSTTPQIVAAAVMPVPVLCDLPVLGEVLFRHTLPVYAAFALVPVFWYVIQKTPVGLTLRAVGEKAVAADTMGIEVSRVRYAASLVCGAMSGFAGAYLSTASLNTFLEGMTGGLGWIAVAIVIFGNWSAPGIMFAALTFGGAQALQLRLQNAGATVPRELIVMLPYLLTLFALGSVVRRSDPPGQLCVPYRRNRRH